MSLFGSLIYRCTTGITLSSQSLVIVSVLKQYFYSDIASIHSESCRASNCLISSTGQVSCIPPCLHTARCSADFSNWPFDTQNCSVHIGTWINAGDEVDFKVAKTIIPESDLQSQNKLWKMLKVIYMRNHGNYSSTKKTYVALCFHNASPH